VLRDVSYQGRDDESRADADSGPAGDSGSAEMPRSEGSAGANGARPARHVPMDRSGANTGYSVATRTIANANTQVGQRMDFVPLPAALRTPHWRRP